MFEKDKTSEEHVSSQTIIGPSVKIEGDFKSEDNVEVSGQIKGTLTTSQDINVLEGAKLKAEVTAKNVKIAGEVNGNIKVHEKIELLSTAKINGDIETEIISEQSLAQVSIIEDAKTKNLKVKYKAYGDYLEEEFGLVVISANFSETINRNVYV